MLSTFKLALLQRCANACAITCALFPLAAAGARPDPADPKAPVPAVRYLSPPRTYQGSADAPLAPWREVNDRLWQRNGAAPAAAASAPMPLQGGHAGHHAH